MKRGKELRKDFKMIAQCSYDGSGVHRDDQPITRLATGRSCCGNAQPFCFGDVVYTVKQHVSLTFAPSNVRKKCSQQKAQSVTLRRLFSQMNCRETSKDLDLM